jgi:hypothetical protein
VQWRAQSDETKKAYEERAIKMNESTAAEYAAKAGPPVDAVVSNDSQPVSLLNC